MTTLARFSPAVLLLAVVAWCPVAALAVVPVVRGPPALTPVPINTSPGDQFDPHVNGDWVTYTDDIRVRYFNFTTGIDTEIPAGGAARDLLSDVSGSRIAFSRVTVGVGTAVMVFDAATPGVAPVEVDATPGSTRIGAAIGGNTVAYIDFGLEAHGELVIHDLTSGLSVRITNDSEIDGNPAVSPDGNVVVWEHCAIGLTNCDIWQAAATRNAGTTIWSTSVTASSSSPEANPDTSGLLTAGGNGRDGQVVYDSQRVPSNPDIFWRPVGGGDEVQLELSGLEGNPSIAGQYLAFESRASLLDSADIFVYDLVGNTLYQVTNTPLVNEQLNDITVLPDSECTAGSHCLRVVWASDEDGIDQRNIRAATFKLASDFLAPVITVPATITVYATSAGSAVVTYSVTATDDVTANPVVTCAPPSGSAFPIGTTTVNCSAHDAAGNNSAATFSVVVLVDSIPPVLNVPSTITVNATSPAGAVVNFTVSATDNVTTNPVVACSPRAGATFAIGTTVVRCTATDAAGNGSTRSFSVVVRGASTACLAIDAFIAQVMAQSGHSLTAAQATQLITWAKWLKGNIGCPY